MNAVEYFQVCWKADTTLQGLLFMKKLSKDYDWVVKLGEGLFSEWDLKVE